MREVDSLTMLKILDNTRQHLALRHPVSTSGMESKNTQHAF